MEGLAAGYTSTSAVELCAYAAAAVCATATVAAGAACGSAFHQHFSGHSAGD